MNSSGLNKLKHKHKETESIHAFVRFIFMCSFSHKCNCPCLYSYAANKARLTILVLGLITLWGCSAVVVTALMQLISFVCLCLFSNNCFILFHRFCKVKLLYS